MSLLLSTFLSVCLLEHINGRRFQLCFIAWYVIKRYSVTFPRLGGIQHVPHKVCQTSGCYFMNNFKYENLYQHTQYDKMLRHYEHFNICIMLYTKLLKFLFLSYYINKKKVTSRDIWKEGKHEVFNYSTTGIF